MAKSFLLVFQDLLTHSHRKPESYDPPTRVIRAESKEDLIKRFGLKWRTREPVGYYWDGKMGEVLISVYQVPFVGDAGLINSVEELREVTLRLHQEWY